VDVRLARIDISVMERRERQFGSCSMVVTKKDFAKQGAGAIHGCF